jgi:hypothetical protein
MLGVPGRSLATPERWTRKLDALGSLASYFYKCQFKPLRLVVAYRDNPSHAVVMSKATALRLNLNFSHKLYCWQPKLVTGTIS